MLFRHGKSAKQVQLWLGHHSPAFTMSTYVHLLPDDLGDAPDLTGPVGQPVGQHDEPRPAEMAASS
jgi:integrase